MSIHKELYKQKREELEELLIKLEINRRFWHVPSELLSKLNDLQPSPVKSKAIKLVEEIYF
jgi:hypothetical protein